MVRLPHPAPLEPLVLPADSLATIAAAQGAVAPVAVPLFTDYLLAFEVTSVLLLAAIVGAVVLGRRRSDIDRAWASEAGGQSAGGALEASDAR